MVAIGLLALAAGGAKREGTLWEKRYSNVKVLVACEFSGVVRDAFTAAGHDATSCDFERSETPGVHVLGDVLKILDLGWDLIVAHPPCTYLASSGARWWPARLDEQADALNFVYKLCTAPCPRIAIENPVGRLSAEFRKPDQIIQPWQFGHPEWKTTCLWLKGLPKLEPTAVVEPDKTVGGGKKPGRISSRLHRMGPSAKRQRERSRTFTGIAAAMAAQWGSLPLASDPGTTRYGGNRQDGERGMGNKLIPMADATKLVMRSMSCTCHADDKPPVCQHRYAVHECLDAYWDNSTQSAKACDE